MRRVVFTLVFFVAVISGNYARGYFTEKIDRGIVALTIDEKSVYVGWRLFRSDPPDIGFNIYRKETGLTDYVKINNEPIRSTTDYIDRTVRPGRAYRYKIKSVAAGKEVDEPGEAYLFMLPGNQPFYSLKLRDNTRPKRIGIGDLNGDGAYDFVVQLPDFNVDPYYMPGYWVRSPEPYRLEAYNSEGKFMWVYDMGWSIETGTWYAPYLVFDIDQDGFAEVYAKAGEGDPRERDGHVLDGPEYLVKINPETGAIVSRKPWLSKDGFNGDYNYWSRNFLSVAYLDGKNPYLIMQRGTYTVIKTEALDRSLNRYWYWESTGEYEKYKGQGQHGIMQADLMATERMNLFQVHLLLMITETHCGLQVLSTTMQDI